MLLLSLPHHHLTAYIAWSILVPRSDPEKPVLLPVVKLIKGAHLHIISVLHVSGIPVGVLTRLGCVLWWAAVRQGSTPETQ